jgi:phenylacetate-coenzyme A ligase PaaK-like adenylate-forming protein
MISFVLPVITKLLLCINPRSPVFNHLTGRTKDIIIKNGQNYYSHDIERVAENVKDIELG